jgi:hypothetical protein
LAKLSVNKPQRVYPKFAEDMKSVMHERMLKGLAKPVLKEIGMAEATRLLTRTSVYEKALQELRTKPKKVEVFN